MLGPVSAAVEEVAPAPPEVAVPKPVSVVVATVEEVAPAPPEVEVEVEAPKPVSVAVSVSVAAVEETALEEEIGGGAAPPADALNLT